MTPPRDDELERLEEDELLPDRDAEDAWDDFREELEREERERFGS